jgi:diacylglycerol kinase family enzyme
MRSQLRRADRAQEEIDGRPVLFACIAGTGLDAAVNRRTLEQPRWLRAQGGYVLALIQVLARFRPPRITVSAQEGGAWRKLVDETGFLVAVGNGPQYGSGMRLTHRARMDDGKLDVCVVRNLSKWRLLRLFHKVFKGRHIGMKEVAYQTAERVRLHTDPVTEVFADGEYICNTPVEVGVRREAFRVIVPAA